MNETELFYWVKKHIEKDLTISKDRFSSYDAFSPSSRTLYEFKCRTENWESLMIEESKFLRLMSFGVNCVYICSIPKGIYAINLNDINGKNDTNREPQWKDVWCNATTEFNKYSKIVKRVAFIPLELFTKID